MNRTEVSQVVQKVAFVLQEKRKKRENELPRVPLTHKHLERCELVLNRSDLLERLPVESVGAELGVDEGRFTCRIRDIVRPRKLHLVDLWDTERYHDGKYEQVRSNFAQEIEENRFVIHRQKSVDALNEFPDHYFDWVYIDTDHSYETTREELELCASKVKPYGWIAGHDYETGNWVTTYRYGVIEAVHEFCVRENWEIRLLTADPLENRSFAICRMDRE